MDLCLIPPIQHLRQFPQKRHLVLSHLLTDQRYRQFYLERREAGDFIILDNSAHEVGVGEGPGKLLLQALDLRPNELVVPDSLEDMQQTIDFAQNALLSWYGSEGRLRGIDLRLMYVPQGKTPGEWARCLIRLIQLHEQAVEKWGAPEKFTIGISKDYSFWPGGLAMLVVLAKPFTTEDHELHLLGSGHDYWTAAELGKEYPIRSIDTAKPFTWAMHGMRMGKVSGPTTLPENLPKRPYLYFYTHLEDMALAHHNAEVLREMIEG